MFDIKSYLWYKNTPDSKPIILRENIDYRCTNSEEIFRDEYDAADAYNLCFKKDCRPLISYDHKNLTEMDMIIIRGSEGLDLYGLVGGSDYKIPIVEETNRLGIDWSSIEDNPVQDNHFVERLGSFFDDPEKYSKILWNCNEEKGWRKVFKILGIE